MSSYYKQVWSGKPIIYKMFTYIKYKKVRDSKLYLFDIIILLFATKNARILSLLY